MRQMYKSQVRHYRGRKNTFHSNTNIATVNAQIKQTYIDFKSFNGLFRDFSRIWLFCLGPLVLLFPKLQIIWLSNLSILIVPDEGYSSNVPDEGYSDRT